MAWKSSTDRNVKVVCKFIAKKKLSINEMNNILSLSLFLKKDQDKAITTENQRI